ncbi:MAG: PDZ domain-containing protein [Myxococcales bacterium]|nr:PDZ domain-containing protein [Myxococcales bacterium]MCB9544713.1 PDZ domain-containing protein [Myxococcales bacterium]
MGRRWGVAVGVVWAASAAGAGKPGLTGPSVDGHPVGRWERRDFQGRVLEVQNHDEAGLRHGEQVFHGADGALCGVSTLTHGTGLLREFDGKCTLRAERHLVDDRLHGELRMLDPQGRELEVSGYAAGWRHGRSVRFTYAPKTPVEVETSCFYRGRRIWKLKGDRPAEKACPVETLGDIGAIWSPLFRRVEGGFVIEALIPGGPAEAAGLQVGDAITHIDGVEALGPAEEITHGRLLGPAGSQVKLTVKRGEATLEVAVERRMPDFLKESAMLGTVR